MSTHLVLNYNCRTDCSMYKPEYLSLQQKTKFESEIGDNENVLQYFFIFFETLRN